MGNGKSQGTSCTVGTKKPSSTFLPYHECQGVKNSAARLISGMTKLSFRKKGAGIVHKVLRE